MNYNFLQKIEHLTLHYSSDCNMLCKYCYIEKHHKVVTNYNKNIRAALTDGSFLQHIFDIYNQHPEWKENIKGYSLWGAEPTVNGDLFKKTHNALMDYFPSLSSVMFSTNALVGGDKIINDFILPITEKTNDHPFILDLQFSLDGPPWLNDVSRGPGATERTLAAVKKVIEKTPMDSNLTVNLTFKPTIDIATMHRFVDYKEDLQNWYDWFDEIGYELTELAEKNSAICARLNGSPTFVVPMLATVEDGIYCSKYIDALTTLDASKWKLYKYNQLFMQGYTQIVNALSGKYQDYDFQFGGTTCSAGKNNFTFDYDGSINTCFHIIPTKMDLYNDKAFTLDEHIISDKRTDKSIKKLWGEYSYHANYQTRYHMFTILATALARQNQILHKYVDNRDENLMLWWAMTPFTCHLTNQDLTGNECILPLGQLRLWGNGAIDALKRYYTWETKRLYIKE